MEDEVTRTVLMELIDEIDDMFHGGVYPKERKEFLEGYIAGIGDVGKLVWKKMGELIDENK